MEPRELLQALVDTVDALGELAATVAGLDGDVQVAVQRRSLREALGTFTQRLCDSLCHRNVTYLEHHNVTSLGQALATLGATPGTAWADVRATWWESMEKLARSWWWVDGDATDLLDACGNTGTAKATTEATARPRDLRNKTAGGGTAGDNLVVAAQQLPVALPSAAAAKAREEAVVATGQAGVATRRGLQEEVALGLLGHLVAAYDKAPAFPWELQRRLGDIELALAETEEESRDVPEASVAAVAEAKRLWEASAHLAKCHLLDALGDIHNLLSSPSGSPISPGGPGGHTVAERCQRAIEDIPRLLGGQ